MSLSAAVLAGGYSRRMRRDKALLPDPTHGTLLQRQLSLLAALCPDELLVSCRPDQALPELPGIRCIHDLGTHGPLGGLNALFGAMHSELLLVLAVDLGSMSAACLGRILARADPGRGVVPRTPAGFEPLAAVYPRALAGSLARRLEAGVDLSMNGFVRAGVQAGLLEACDIPPDDVPFFANWNSPADLRERPP